MKKFSMRLLTILLLTNVTFVMTFANAGSQACQDCHTDITDFFKKTPHKHSFFSGEKGYGCESCHGNASKHIESEDPSDIKGVDALKNLSNMEKSATCLKCHVTNLHDWENSSHKVEASCWDCHAEALHFKKTKKQHKNTCKKCHNEIASRMELQYSHKMKCSECHNPHGESENIQEASEMCLKCHTEYRGPFVFEHGALDEGCESCHNVHGSASRKLLTISGNGLCLQCHNQSDFPAIGKKVHSSQLSGGALCYDCHTQVHGSNTDPNFSPRLR